jgi:hypothetical protein
MSSSFHCLCIDSLAVVLGGAQERFQIGHVSEPGQVQKRTRRHQQVMPVVLYRPTLQQSVQGTVVKEPRILDAPGAIGCL